MQGNGYVLRDLEEEDYGRGFIRCLNELTEPVDITEEQFRRQFSMISNGDYRVIVAYSGEEDRIVGSGTLLIERKFIRGCAMKGHIEDVVVLGEKRGLGIGREIVKRLIELSKAAGCYKTALVCDVKNVKFYEKCGLVEKEREMVIYH